MPMIIFLKIHLSLTSMLDSHCLPPRLEHRTSPLNCLLEESAFASLISLQLFHDILLLVLVFSPILWFSAGQFVHHVNWIIVCQLMSSPFQVCFLCTSWNLIATLLYTNWGNLHLVEAQFYQTFIPYPLLLPLSVGKTIFLPVSQASSCVTFDLLCWKSQHSNV